MKHSLPLTSTEASDVLDALNDRAETLRQLAADTSDSSYLTADDRREWTEEADRLDEVADRLRALPSVLEVQQAEAVAHHTPTEV